MNKTNDRRESNFTQAIAELDRQTDLEAAKWIRENRSSGVLMTCVRMLGGFWTSYFGRKGHRRGIEGLFEAVNAGMYPFLTYVKFWEKRRNKETRP